MKVLDKILMAISGRLPCRIINDGDTPYLERYYVGTLFGWRFYLHRFVGSDPDRGLHDHPWSRAFSIVLSGWYWEKTRSGVRPVSWFNSLTGDTFHRVILPNMASPLDLPNMRRERPCWTLFFHRVGDVKPWGFLSKDGLLDFPYCQVFVPYDYAKEGGKKADWWLTAPKGKDVRRDA